MLTVASSLFGYVIDMWRQQKPNQYLDPISVVCTLAMRTLCLPGTKPAARTDWFEWDEPSATQWAIRSATKVSNNDLFFLNDSIKLFVVGWKGKECAALVEIAKVAMVGLDILRREYSAEMMNGAPTCEWYQFMLKHWVAEAESKIIGPPPEDAAQREALRAKAAQEIASLNKPDDPAIKLLEGLLEQWTISGAKEFKANQDLRDADRETIERINALWPKSEIEAFALLLKNGAMNKDPLNAILERHKKSYQGERAKLPNKS